MTRMHKFGMVDNSNCIRCGQPETIEHLLISCNYVKQVWDCLKVLVGEDCQMNDVWNVFEWKQPLYSIEMCCKLISKDRPKYDTNKLAQLVFLTISNRLCRK